MIWYPVIGLLMMVIVIVFMLHAEKVEEMPIVVGVAVLSFLTWPAFVLFIATWWIVLILQSVVTKAKK